MLGLANFRCCITSCALGLDQLDSINEFTTAVALVPLCVMVVAHWALTTNESVSKESRALKAVLLINDLFKGVALLLEIIEDCLSNFGLFVSTSTAEVIKVNVKPIIDLLVESIVLGTYLFRGLSFLLSFGFGSGTVLVSPTNKESVVACEASISSVNIS